MASPPGGTELRVQSSAHDFGTYQEVVYCWPSSNPEGHVYADKVERGLATWRDAGFWTPVLYDERSQAVQAIRDVALLDMATNPDAQPTREARDAHHMALAARDAIPPG